MEFLADGLLIAGALTIAVYCFVLSRRLAALKDMDSGLGKAIGALSDQVEETRTTLRDTRDSTAEMIRELSALTARAEIAAGRLELLLATVHERKPEAAGKADASEEPATKRKVAAKRDLLDELQKIAGKSLG